MAMTDPLEVTVVQDLPGTLGPCQGSNSLRAFATF